MAPKTPMISENRSSSVNFNSTSRAARHGSIAAPQLRINGGHLSSSSGAVSRQNKEWSTPSVREPDQTSTVVP